MTQADSLPLPTEPEDKSAIQVTTYPDIRIEVNVPAREVVIFEGEEVSLRYPIAIGSPAYKTPLQDREMTQIIWNPSWYPPDSPWAKGAKPEPPGPHNPLGPVKMSLGGDILMHGTNRESSIGRAASHGCLRMKNADASQLARWLQEKLTDQTDPALFEKYAQQRYSTHIVPLAKTVPVKFLYEVYHIEGEGLKAYPDVYGKVKDREENFWSFMESQGYNLAHIHRELASKAIAESKKETVSVSLHHLFPGFLRSNEARILDPVEQAWLARKNTVPHSERPLLSFLF